MKNFKLQNPTEFINDFQKEASKAKKRVWIQTMFFETGKKTKLFENALLDCLKRKLDVQIVIDWSTRTHTPDDRLHFYPILPLKKQKRKEIRQFSKANQRMFNRLKNNGAKILIANHPWRNGSLIPILKRNHSKLFITDDIVWTGGINLSDRAFDNIDFMIKFKNEKIINAMEKQFPHIQRRSTKNYFIDLDDSYRLLVDNGRYNKSIIYNHALEMVDRAKEEIILISQYAPGGALLKKLIEKANKRINVIIITSYKEHPSFTKYPYKPFYKILRSKIKHNPYIKLIHCSKKVHAKLLEVDKKEVIFGSHNFFHVTVFVGTQEISIYSKDKKLIKTLDKFAMDLYKNHLGKYSISSSSSI
jgi:phosphatidylserine/phosphatidylglycerophosphate/cardiolipin synthase-like enzyme